MQQEVTDDSAAQEKAAAEDARKKEEEARKKEEEARKKAEEQANAEAEARKKLEATKQQQKQEAEQEAKRQAEEQAKREAEIEAKRLDKSEYEEVGTRDWALVVKNPDAHIGEKYVIYGHITQFDSATGPDAFLADTDAKSRSEAYEYEHNTLVRAYEQEIVNEVVENDFVKMYVEVVSSFSYDTQIGGNTTVPLVEVSIIEVAGSSR